MPFKYDSFEYNYLKFTLNKVFHTMGMAFGTVFHAFALSSKKVGVQNDQRVVSL